MKRIMIILLVLILVILVVVGGYVAYALIDYSRIEDLQELVVAQHSEELMPAGKPQRIVSWNVGFGAYNSDFSFFMDGGTESRAFSKEICESNMQTMIESLKKQAPDIIHIQEVDVKGTRSHGVNQVAMIENAFLDSHSSVYAENYDSSYLFYPIHKPIGANQGGILTLADVRMDGATRISLPIESGFNKFFDLDRCYSISRIPVDNGKMLCLYNFHLSAYTSDGSIATKQLALMLKDMQAEYDLGHYVIAGGDFNKDVWGNSVAYTGIPGGDVNWYQPFPMEVLPESFVLVDSLNTEKLVLSCRDTGAPYEKGKTFEATLDGFIVSDNVEVISSEVIDEGFVVSDHNPVCMDFKLK